MNTINFYLAPDGNDANPGTLELPFATLERARDAIRALRDADGHLPGPVTVLLRGGKYYLDDTFHLYGKDSGTADTPVTYAAYPGETPVLSGGKIIAGWEPDDDAGVFKAAVPEAKGGHWPFRQLFIDGEVQTRARWPKHDPDNPRFTGWAMCNGYVGQNTEEQSNSTFYFKDDLLPDRKWAKPQAIEVYMYAGHAFTQIVPLKRLAREHRIIELTRDISSDFMPRPSHETRFFLENIREEIAREGEWCLDAEDGVLYLKAPGGTLDGKTVVAPYLQTLIALKGVQWVTIAGLTFVETLDGDDTLRIYQVGYGAQFPHQGTRYVGDALYFRDCDHCTITGNTFDTVGGNAIYGEFRNEQVHITRNLLHRVGAYGVVLMGRRDGNYPINCEITDNEIREPGFRHQYTTAIFTGLSDGITIAHNYIHHCPQYAINLGNNGFGRNYVEFNEIRFTNLEKFDAGAISCWMDESEDGEAYFPPTLIKPRAERSGHIIRYNLIADTCGCRIEEDDTLMPDNHLTKRFWNFSNAIYTDDGSSNCVISHNILIRAGVGIKLHTTKHQVVENNIIVDCLYQLELCNVVPHRSPIMMTTLKDFMRGNRFCRNIFYATKALPAEPDFARISVYSDDFVQHDMMQRWDENLYFSEMPVEWCGGDNGRHMMGEYRFTLADWQARGYDRHTVLADPKFADVAKEDFTLATDSPALALGFQPIPFEKIGIRKVTER